MSVLNQFLRWICIAMFMQSNDKISHVFLAEPRAVVVLDYDPHIMGCKSLLELNLTVGLMQLVVSSLCRYEQCLRSE